MDSCAASEGLGDSDPDPKVRQIPANAVGEGGVPGTGREEGEVTPQPFGNTVLQARAVVGDAPGSASYPSFLYQRRRLSSAVWLSELRKRHSVSPDVSYTNSKFDHTIPTSRTDCAAVAAM